MKRLFDPFSVGKPQAFVYVSATALVVFLVGLFVGGILRHSRTACFRCNVVVFDIQLLRDDSMPCRGYPRNTTPNICAFAAAHTTWTHVYSASSWTLPSMMSLFSSQYPHEHGVVVPGVDVLSPSVATLPQALHAAGYTTIFIGPTSRPHVPLDKGIGRGFDEIRQYRSIPDLKSLLADLKGSRQPVFIYVLSYDLFDDLWYDISHPPQSFVFDRVRPPAGLLGSGDRDLKQALLQYVKEHATESPALTAGLRRLAVSQRDEDVQSVYRSLSDDDRQLISFLQVQNRINPGNPDHMAYVRNFYDDRLVRLDRDLGVILHELEKPEIARRTVTAIFSDHGNEFGEHGGLNHGSNLYATTTHIPFILAVPGVGLGLVNALTSNIDLYPTLLGLLGLTKPPSVHGKDMSGFIIKPQGETERNQYVFGELNNGYKIRSLRSLDWSFYWTLSEKGQDSFALYALTADSGERHNVVSDQTALVTAFKSMLRPFW